MLTTCQRGLGNIMSSLPRCGCLNQWTGSPKTRGRKTVKATREPMLTFSWGQTTTWWGFHRNAWHRDLAGKQCRMLKAVGRKLPLLCVNRYPSHEDNNPCTCCISNCWKSDGIDPMEKLWGKILFKHVCNNSKICLNTSHLKAYLGFENSKGTNLPFKTWTQFLFSGALLRFVMKFRRTWLTWQDHLVVVICNCACPKTWIPIMSIISNTACDSIEDTKTAAKQNTGLHVTRYLCNVCYLKIAIVTLKEVVGAHRQAEAIATGMSLAFFCGPVVPQWTDA